MNLKAEFLSEKNVVLMSQMFKINKKDIFSIMNDYSRESVIQMSKGCLPVLNHMFIQTLSNQDYEPLGYSICNKIDKQDLNYQTMMPKNPYLITNRDKNMQQWAQLTSARQPQKIGLHQGTFLRINDQKFTDMKQMETENIQYTNFTSNYYKTPQFNSNIDSQYYEQLYLPHVQQLPYSYIDSRTLY